MLAMVVDIASRVVTARDTRAGAWTLGSRKILDTLDFQMPGLIWIPEVLGILWVLTELRSILKILKILKILELLEILRGLTELRSIQNENQETTTIMLHGM